MAIRELLVHLDTTPATTRRLDLAIALAAKLEARLTGLFSVADAHVQSLSSPAVAERLARTAAGAEPAFRERAAAAGVDAEWLSTISRDDVAAGRAVIQTARTVDLAVLGQFDPATANGAVPPTLVEQAVMCSGRPVLVVPFAGTFGAVGNRVIIAWNGSREAARALNDALPMLAGAEEVTVLALSPSRVKVQSDAAGSAEIIRHLRAHGVEAASDRLVFKAREIDPAERLLSHLADCGADLLVMGAWPRVGERNSLTTGVLARTTVPMLLSY